MGDSAVMSARRRRETLGEDLRPIAAQRLQVPGEGQLEVWTRLEHDTPGGDGMRRRNCSTRPTRTAWRRSTPAPEVLRRGTFMKSSEMVVPSWASGAVVVGICRRSSKPATTLSAWMPARHC